MSSSPSAGDASQQPPPDNSVFGQAARWSMKGYDYLANKAGNDAVKGAMISQRTTVDTALKTTATYSNKLAEVVAVGAQKLVTGDHKYQIAPLPNWLLPTSPILGVKSTLPIVAVYGGVALFPHRLPFRWVSFETSNPQIAGPMPAFQPRIVKIAVEMGLTTQEEIVAVSRNIEGTSVANGDGATLMGATVRNFGGGGGDDYDDDGGDATTRTMTHTTTGGAAAAASSSAVPATTSTEQEFDLVNDEQPQPQPQQQQQQHLLGSTFNGTAGTSVLSSVAAIFSSATTNNNNNSAPAENTNIAAEGTTTTTRTTQQYNNGTTTNNASSVSVVAAAAAATSPTGTMRSLVVAAPPPPTTDDQLGGSLTNRAATYTKRALLALHPTSLFQVDDLKRFRDQGNYNHSFVSYHACSAFLFTMSSATSLLALRVIAQNRGVKVSSLLPSAVRVAMSSVPVFWGADAVSRFTSSTAQDMIPSLQFACGFSLIGACLHIVPAVTELLFGKQSSVTVRPAQQHALNNAPADANGLQLVQMTLDYAAQQERQQQQQQQQQQLAATTTTTTVAAAAPSSSSLSQKISVACHYCSLLFDVNFATQLCVLAPQLPSIVKVFPAMHAIVVRNYFLTDGEFVKSYLKSPTRWILLLGSLRHFTMLTESAPEGDMGNNFLSHVFPRLLSLALLPIHLSALWLPIHPRQHISLSPHQSVSRHGGGGGGGGGGIAGGGEDSIVAATLGLLTGTAWSPGSLAAANVAWFALYFSQGTSTLNTAVPRISTFSESSTMPAALYTLCVEGGFVIAKMLSTLS